MVPLGIFKRLKFLKCKYPRKIICQPPFSSMKMSPSWVVVFEKKDAWVEYKAALREWSRRQSDSSDAGPNARRAGSAVGTHTSPVFTKPPR